MNEDASRSKVDPWSVYLASCAILTALPLWSARYLPFTDLPEHTAVAAALRHWFDASWHLQSTYTLDFVHTPYSLYYVVCAVLSIPFGSAERANTVILTLVALGFPYSIRALARALRADERLALFACPMFWNQSLLIGFFSYVAAIPLALFMLSLVLRQLAEPTRKRAITLGALTVALLFLHLSMLAFFVVASLLASLHVPGDIRQRIRATPRRLAWLAPAAVVLAGIFLTSSVFHPARVGWSEPRKIEFEPLDQELSHLFAVFDVWHGAFDEVCVIGLVFVGALIAWPRVREPDAEVGSRSLVASWMVVAIALFLFVPQKIGWLWQLNERFTLPFALLIPLLLRPEKGTRSTIALGVVGALGVAIAGNSTRAIRAFQSEVAGFDEVIDRAEPGKRVLTLVFESESSVARFAPFLHFGAYYRARGGGVVAPSFAELPQSPLRYRAEEQPPWHPYGWEWEPERVVNDSSQAYFDYVLVRGSDPVAFLVAGPSRPSWRLVSRNARWALFARE
jgi:hypothetical protein